MTTTTKAPRMKNLNAQTAYYTGTTQYYRYPLMRDGRYTDGVQFIASEFEAYWLLDVIFSHVNAIYRSTTIPQDQKRLLVCKLTVNDEKNSALFTVEDGNDNELARQEIEYTDFPALEQIIWVQNGVAMLPSEY